MRRTRHLATLTIVSVLTMGASCGAGSGEPLTPYDLPVVTTGGIEEEEVQYATTLTISTEIEDPDVPPELIEEIETQIAFDNYPDFNGCESKTKGWEGAFKVGSVAISFTLTILGATEDVSLTLTTGDPPPALTTCLVDVVEAMQLSVAPGESDVAVHLLLRYGD
jgi:hypothetical protein